MAMEGKRGKILEDKFDRDVEKGKLEKSSKSYHSEKPERDLKEHRKEKEYHSAKDRGKKTGKKAF